MLPDEARLLARRHLAEALPRRWRHVEAVARTASEISKVVQGDASVLVAAAWLHDIGYSPDIAASGFHPLDGALYLRSQGANERVCRLVAHHTAASIEAELRGLQDELLSEFELEKSSTADALWYADLTTGPDGERLTVEERITEIRARYGPGAIVTRFIDLAEESLLCAVRRTESRAAAL
jgi:putative nucleotidyltransferase with HDIG domain